MRLPTLLCLAAAAACTAVPAHAQALARPDRFSDAMSWAMPLGAAAYAAFQGDREGLLQLGESWAAAELAAEGIKRTIHDPRPTGQGRGAASGHAAGTFAVAGFMHRRYGLEAAAPAYALATAVAYGRVHTHHHFTRQVIVGAAAGLGSAALFTRDIGPRQQASLAVTPAGWRLAYVERF